VGVGDIDATADSTETPPWLGMEVPPGSENTAERQRVQREHGRSHARLPRSRAGESRLGRLNNHLAHSVRLLPDASEETQSGQEAPVETSETGVATQGKS